MKMSKIVALILVVVMALSTLASCKPNGGDKAEGKHEYEALNGTYNITMWVSEIDGVAGQFQEQIDAFEAKYPGIIINAEIEGVGENDAGSMVINDVSTAPDIYCFAQDQLARLVQAAALAAPASKVEAELKAANDAGSIAAASVGGKLYAYPLTSDNGYYMFYDSSLFTAEDVESMEKIIEICEANNVKFRYPVTNGWYNAGFFFATGCESVWTVDSTGNFSAVNDTYNSDKGLVAMKAMQKLTQSACFDADNNVLIDSGVVISGTWAVNDMKEFFGENYAATDLPSFTVDGQTYHMGSFTGNKLMGVKPQAAGEENKAAVLSLLAQFLTNGDCQLQRFEEFGWGPSNLVAQQSEAVQADPALAALAKQAAYGRPQGQIHGDWWKIAEALGTQARDAKNDDELKAYLSAYENAIKALIK